MLAFVLVATVYTQVVARKADRAQSELSAALAAAFAGTTSADVDQLYEDDVVAAERESESGELDAFLRRGNVEPDYFRPIDGLGYEARYGTGYGGQHRCVVVTWAPDGLYLTRASGKMCRASPE